MLAFERHSASINDEVMFDCEHLILAGWSARDEAAVRGHMAELAEHGVPPPSTFPLFYRVSASLVSQTDRLEVLGPHTSGEIEYVIVAMDDGLWVTVGSDQTDRKAEAHGVALSKQLAGKVLGRTLWRLDELRDRWDSLVLRAHVVIDGERVLYQEGALALMRTPDDLMQRYGKPLTPGHGHDERHAQCHRRHPPCVAFRDAARGCAASAIHHPRLRCRRSARDCLASLRPAHFVLGDGVRDDRFCVCIGQLREMDGTDRRQHRARQAQSASGRPWSRTRPTRRRKATAHLWRCKAASNRNATGT